MTVKQQILEMLSRLPDDCTMEDVEYHLYVMGRIQAGLEDLEQGNVLDQEEVEQIVSQWSAE